MGLSVRLRSSSDFVVSSSERGSLEDLTTKPEFVLRLSKGWSKGTPTQHSSFHVDIFCYGFSIRDILSKGYDMVDKALTANYLLSTMGMHLTTSYGHEG